MSSLKRLSITEFLSEVPAEYKDFVSQAHGLLTKDGYKSKFQLRKYGFTAQYNSPNTKGLALQFFVRDNVLYMYLYNIFLYEYKSFLDNLPSVIIKEFVEYRNCTNACSACTCTELKYTINGTLYHKCVVGRILFTVDSEITGLLSVLQESAK